MNSKVKAVVSVVLFVVFLGALKIIYDRTLDRRTGSAGNPVLTSPALTQGPDTKQTVSGPLTQPTTAAAQQTVPLPDVTLYDAAGNTVKLSSFSGRKIILNAWASWCGPCKAEMPDFEELDQASDGSYQIVMVNITSGLETRENADRFLNDNDLDFSVMLYDEDLEFAQGLQIDSIPTTIFVDEAGQIHFYQPGLMTKEQVLAALAMVK